MTEGVARGLASYFCVLSILALPRLGERILEKSIQQRDNPQPAVLKTEGKLEHPALPGSLYFLPEVVSWWGGPGGRCAVL